MAPMNEDATISVTANDIKGAGMWSNECPIWQSLTRRAKPEFKFSVGTSEVWVFKEDGIYAIKRIDLPPAAAEFSRSYFKGLADVKPIRFKLPVAKYLK